MKRMTRALAGTLMLTGAAAQAEDQWSWLASGGDEESTEKPHWTWLAGGAEGFQAQPSVALLAGQMDPSGGMDNDTVSGIELSLNCPLLQPPSNRIRQQLSYTKYDNGGTEIESIEINPHYIVEVFPGLEVGGGPGLGFVMVDTASGDGNVFSLQLGASAHYHAGSPLYLGGEIRYQLTGEDSFGGVTKSDVNNYRIMLKVGYSL